MRPAPPPRPRGARIPGWGSDRSRRRGERAGWLSADRSISRRPSSRTTMSLRPGGAPHRQPPDPTAGAPAPPPRYHPDYPQPGQSPPPPGACYGPSAPFGRHPRTGEPLSDKSKVIAGLLQLMGLFGLVGVGRIYLGYTGLGVAQLLVGLVTCGIGAVVWGIIDAVLILTDKVRDPEGRPLRDGT